MRKAANLTLVGPPLRNTIPSLRVYVGKPWQVVGLGFYLSTTLELFNIQLWFVLISFEWERI